MESKDKSFEKQYQEMLKEESNAERKIRRNEVGFSKLLGKSENGNIENILAVNSKNAFDEENVIDKLSRKQSYKILKNNINKLADDEKDILLDYINKVKQKDIAEKYGISPSALKQKLDKILYNYRVILCNDADFVKTDSFDKIQTMTEYEFKKYFKNAYTNENIDIDLDNVQDFIKEAKKAIRQTSSTGADVDVREKINNEIDFSNVSNGMIKNFNDAFASVGIDADLGKLKSTKFTVTDMFNMVEDFINQTKNEEKEDDKK